MKKSIIVAFIMFFSIFSFSHTEHLINHYKIDIAIDNHTNEFSEAYSGHPLDDSLKFVTSSTTFITTFIFFMLLSTSMLHLFIRYKKIIAMLTPIRFQSNYVVKAPFSFI
ncbi:hypothetical protein [Robertmurraya massiliosenegalensis]|uniref:hypothetical protein n=1 Tax=Robertmurraya massiliosenegalensis TaxID=1287657 RepID=UPI0002DD9AC4|nr:hypothetical protein [Robertmurraya massiliosenegalensis]